MKLIVVLALIVLNLSFVLSHRHHHKEGPPSEDERKDKFEHPRKGFRGHHGHHEKEKSLDTEESGKLEGPKEPELPKEFEGHREGRKHGHHRRSREEKEGERHGHHRRHEKEREEGDREHKRHRRHRRHRGEDAEGSNEKYRRHRHKRDREDRKSNSGSGDGGKMDAIEKRV